MNEECGCNACYLNTPEYSFTINVNEELSENACDHLVSINDIPVDGGMSGICPLG